MLSDSLTLYKSPVEAHITDVLLSKASDPFSVCCTAGVRSFKGCLVVFMGLKALQINNFQNYLDLQLAVHVKSTVT